ncbi:MAG TPA: FapA family protein [Noviherbaspirillum sp.]|nr:FapA family protein [Noviherbaspirillum sp.]
MEEHPLTSLSISLNEETGELRVGFDPAVGLPPPDLTAFRQAVIDKGWETLYFNDNAVADFFSQCRKTKEALSVVVGARRDGEFSLTLDSDLMTAWLTLVPPQGGKAVALEALGEALREQGINHGILRDQINAAFATGQCDRIAIARGDAPQEGYPTRFESLFDVKEEEPTEEDELDRIQYRDLCHILLVKPGDKLMRRIPPIQGKDGTNIKGQAVLVKQLPDLPFALGLQGAEPDKNNPDLLVASLGGQPILKDNGVMVNPVLDVVDVDLSTGSLTFEGTLRVGGDIKSGMRINVSGDVIVNGTVEAAEIVAGGNVAIRGGIVGHPDSRPGSQSLPETTARIFSKGSVQALFMENAHVEADKSILIDRTARQCELIAREEIIAGKPGSKNSQIIGGKTQATYRIATAILGATTGIKTHVQVGLDPYLEEQLADKERQLQRKYDEVDRVVKLLTYFKQNPQKGAGGIAEKVEGTRQQVLVDIDSLTADIKELRGKVELAEDGQVSVSTSIYFGVEVRIGQLNWQARDDMGGATIKLQAGKVMVEK